MAAKRMAKIKRKTREVNISGNFIIDGQGKSKIKTPFPFLDHMLELFSFHGFFDLDLKVASDLSHHGIEDIGIAVGAAIRNSLNQGRGIKRYGFAYVPMDKTLVRVVTDLSGRPSISFLESLSTSPTNKPIAALTGREEFSQEELIHFLEGLSTHAKLTLHIDYRYDGDTHHLFEAIFKGLGIALNMATSIDKRRRGITSTKGILDF